MNNPANISRKITLKAFNMLDPHTLAQQGWELEQQEKYPEAIALYQKAWQLQPDSLWSEALNLLAIEAAEKQQSQLAQQLWQQAITQAPDYPEAHFNLGQFLIQEGESRGINYLKEATALDPNWPEAHYQLGLQQCNQGQFPEAEASLKHAISLQPDWADPYYTLGMVYYHQKLWQKAKKLFLKVLSIQPEYSDAHFALGQIFFCTLNYEKATAAYERFLSLSKSRPQRESALLNMAWIYCFYKKDFDKPIELAQQIVNYDLDNIGITITLLYSYLNKGQLTSAWSVGS